MVLCPPGNNYFAKPPHYKWGCAIHAQGDGVGTQSLSWTIPISGHGQQFDIDFASAVITKYSLILQLGGLFP